MGSKEFRSNLGKTNMDRQNRPRPVCTEVAWSRLRTSPFLLNRSVRSVKKHGPIFTENGSVRSSRNWHRPIFTENWSIYLFMIFFIELISKLEFESSEHFSLSAVWNVKFSFLFSRPGECLIFIEFRLLQY